MYTYLHVIHKYTYICIHADTHISVAVRGEHNPERVRNIIDKNIQIDVYTYIHTSTQLCI